MGESVFVILPAGYDGAFLGVVAAAGDRVPPPPIGLPPAWTFQSLGRGQTKSPLVPSTRMPSTSGAILCS